MFMHISINTMCGILYPLDKKYVVQCPMHVRLTNIVQLVDWKKLHQLNPFGLTTINTSQWASTT
jgi:hypothetical protein